MAAAYVQKMGRPVNAICAIELRCPKPFTKASFGEYNAKYLEKLGSMGMLIDGSSRYLLILKLINELGFLIIFLK